MAKPSACRPTRLVNFGHRCRPLARRDGRTTCSPGPRKSITSALARWDVKRTPNSTKPPTVERSSCCHAHQTPSNARQTRSRHACSAQPNTTHELFQRHAAVRRAESGDRHVEMPSRTTVAGIRCDETSCSRESAREIRPRLSGLMHFSLVRVLVDDCFSQGVGGQDSARTTERARSADCGRWSG